MGNIRSFVWTKDVFIQALVRFRYSKVLFISMCLTMLNGRIRALMKFEHYSTDMGTDETIDFCLISKYEFHTLFLLNKAQIFTKHVSCQSFFFPSFLSFFARSSCRISTTVSICSSNLLRRGSTGSESSSTSSSSS